VSCGTTSCTYDIDRLCLEDYSMNTIFLPIHVLWFLTFRKLQVELCNLYSRTSPLHQNSRSVWHSDRVGVGLVYFVRWSAPLCRHWGSVQAVRPIGGVEVWLYSFMPTVIEGGEGSASRPGRSLPPGKTRYPLYRRLGGPQGRSGQVRKISPPPVFNPRIVQP